jgi:hypothetical protein
MSRSSHLATHTETSLKFCFYCNFTLLICLLMKSVYICFEMRNTSIKFTRRQDRLLYLPFHFLIAFHLPSPLLPRNNLPLTTSHDIPLHLHIYHLSKPSLALSLLLPFKTDNEDYRIQIRSRLQLMNEQTTADT